MMNKEQYELLKSGFMLLKEAHINQDWNLLNYSANIVKGFGGFKDFDAVKKFIIAEIDFK